MTTFTTGSRVSFTLTSVLDDGTQVKKRVHGTVLKVSEFFERYVKNRFGRCKSTYQYTVRDDEGHYNFVTEKRNQMEFLEEAQSLNNDMG